MTDIVLYHDWLLLSVVEAARCTDFCFIILNIDDVVYNSLPLDIIASNNVIIIGEPV